MDGYQGKVTQSNSGIYSLQQQKHGRHAMSALVTGWVSPMVLTRLVTTPMMEENSPPLVLSAYIFHDSSFVSKTGVRQWWIDEPSINQLVTEWRPFRQYWHLTWWQLPLRAAQKVFQVNFANRHRGDVFITVYLDLMMMRIVPTQIPWLLFSLFC